MEYKVRVIKPTSDGNAQFVTIATCTRWGSAQAVYGEYPVSPGECVMVWSESHDVCLAQRQG